MNKISKLAASIVAATALTMGAGSVAFANGGQGGGHGHGPTGIRPPVSATHRDDKDKDDKAEHHVFDCANIAMFDTKAQAKIDKINAYIAKLEKYKVDNAVDLAANPDKLARIDKAIARLHKAVDRVTARVTKVDALCAAQATSTTGATTTTTAAPDTTTTTAAP